VTAPNHALTGALIGLTVHEPLLAAPLAFLSHFACDAVPHYDPSTPDGVGRLSSKEFIRDFLVIGGSLCILLIIVLAVTRPQYWLLAAICAFLATSPDLFWLPRFLRIMRTHTDRPHRSWFLRFHARIQWKTGPNLWWTEALWAIACVSLLIVKMH
jgi:hypothetical protein